MSDDLSGSPLISPNAPGVDEESGDNEKTSTPGEVWGKIWENIVRVGLGETTLRIGTGVVSILLVLLVIWVMSNFYLRGEIDVPSRSEQAVVAAPLPTPTATMTAPSIDTPYYGAYLDGIIRLAQLYTLLPVHPRFDVMVYEVQKGDSLFSIAEKFNLRPQTLLFGNYFTLADNPDRLSPGQKLNILPIDGVYYQWHAGDSLKKVSEYYHVKPEDVISWPGNHLNADTIGDYSYPNIKAGTWLVIPGGTREFISWSAPFIPRQNPAVAKLMGPGFCGAISEGPIGTGTFIWPTVLHWLSGFGYSPETNHYAIDIAGRLGYAVYAVDGGVVVYAGWNDYGYGNTIVIDHGNGWQSQYSHLSALNVGCGAPVKQGDIIGAVGSTGNSTGPHLHFALRSDKYGRPNPLDYLPPP